MPIRAPEHQIPPRTGEAAVAEQGGVVQRFAGQHGQEWRLDTDRPLAPPGGFGQVFAGLADNGEGVAIKLVRLALGDTQEIRRRGREVEITRKLMASEMSLSHLLFPLDWGMHDRDLLLVMPRAERSLAEAIRSSDFDVKARLDAIRQVAEGLMELASIGILHRDLKPGNVLQLGDRWLLSDFGMSRDVNEPTNTYSFQGSGTVQYMAPEIWNLQPATSKSDLYSLGIIIFEVLTGSVPFNAPNNDELRRQHDQDVPPDSIGNPRISRLVTRLLSKKPADRPQDARVVVEAIQAASHKLAPPFDDLAVDAAKSAFAIATMDVQEDEGERVRALRKAALTELGAFLEDFSDDLCDVFPDAAIEPREPARAYKEGFTDPYKILPDALIEPTAAPWSGWCINLGRCFLWILPFRLQGFPFRHGDPSLYACEVFASTRYVEFPELDSTCIANLTCELVSGRLEWKVVTFINGASGPHGANEEQYAGQRGVVVDPEAYGHGPFEVQFSMYTASLTTESAILIMRNALRRMSGQPLLLIGQPVKRAEPVSWIGVRRR